MSERNSACYVSVPFAERSHFADVAALTLEHHSEMTAAVVVRAGVPHAAHRRCDFANAESILAGGLTVEGDCRRMRCGRKRMAGIARARLTAVRRAGDLRCVEGNGTHADASASTVGRQDRVRSSVLAILERVAIIAPANRQRVWLTWDDWCAPTGAILACIEPFAAKRMSY
ncbi:hypothetical protein WT32_02475 [Burkholderia anthina]|nr:hypothetical protein WT32_02475 [Burkholderia anthina]